MNRISRYTLARFLGILFLVIICILFLFLVIDYVEKTTQWATRPKQEIWSYYLNTIPYIIYLILPICIIIASIFSIGKMSSHLEITAMRTSGISTFKILRPILVFGILLTGFMYIFLDTILPEANHKRFKILQPSAVENKYGNPNLKYNFVYRSPNTTFFFKFYYGKEKKGQSVTIFIEKNGFLTERYDARLMQWDSLKSQWFMQDGTYRQFKNGNVKVTSFKHKNLLHIKDKPQEIIANRILPDEMKFKDIQSRININKRSGEDTKRYETQWYLKLATIFVNLIMLMIGLSLSVHTIKSGLARRLGIAIFIFLGYFFTIRFGASLGENGVVSPFHATWFGNYIFGSLALFLFYRACRK